MNISKSFKRAVAAGTIVALAAVAYYSWVLYSARRYTVETILPREKVTLYPLAPSSLTPRRFPAAWIGRFTSGIMSSRNMI